MSGTITHSWNGTILTITSDSGTSSADLKGSQGDTGIRGPQGAAGTVDYSNIYTKSNPPTAEEVGALPADTVIPNTDTFATKEYVEDAIAAIEIPDSGGGESADLSNYYTKAETDTAISNAQPDLNGFATTTYADNKAQEAKDYADAKIHYSATQPSSWKNGDIWLKPNS